MCGIAGYYIDSKIDQVNIRSMIDAQRHRGPDGEGFYFHNNFTGGMNRLSINGLTNGDQPLYNEKKNVIVFYNGEIYNHLQLRKSLQKKGHILKTDSDGEVIAHLYEEFGTNFLQYLDGMFAISLYDKKQNKLYLARDGVGEKPLYYKKISENEIVYASEIKALSKFKNIQLSINEQSLWDFPTFSWIPESYTVFKNVFALLNGHYLEVSNKGILLNKFFLNNKKKLIKNKVDSVFSEVKSSINSRLISEVQVGAFLSGGIDSSIISYFAAKKINNLKTYTIGFKDDQDLYHGKSDESRQAKKFANMLNTDHKTIMIDSSDFLESLDKFSHAGDQPFAVSSGLGILKISEQAKMDGVKVLLSGDCADEIFGGYTWYQYLSELKHLHKSSYIKDLTFLDVNHSIKDRLNSMNYQSPQNKALSLHYYATESEKNLFFDPAFFNPSKSSVRFFYQFNNKKDWKEIDYIKNDKFFYLKNEMLCKLDRMTMANSVEGRVPFASKKLFNLSQHFEFRNLIKDNDLKIILKQAFKNYLPKNILNRKKHGFNVPLDHWFKNEWKNILFHTFSQESKLYKERIINKKNIENFLKFYNNSKKINGHTYLSFVMLNKWMENYKLWR